MSSFPCVGTWGIVKSLNLLWCEDISTLYKYEIKKVYWSVHTLCAKIRCLEYTECMNVVVSLRRNVGNREESYLV